MTKSDAEFFKRAIARRGTDCGGFNSANNGPGSKAPPVEKYMRLNFIKGLIAGSLSTMPEPFRSMPFETEGDRERLALALREFSKRPMPPNASEEI
jgi:hypothetical protein